MKSLLAFVTLTVFFFVFGGYAPAGGFDKSPVEPVVLLAQQSNESSDQQSVAYSQWQKRYMPFFYFVRVDAVHFPAGSIEGVATAKRLECSGSHAAIVVNATANIAHRPVAGQHGHLGESKTHGRPGVGGHYIRGGFACVDT